MVFINIFQLLAHLVLFQFSFSTFNSTWTYFRSQSNIFIEYFNFKSTEAIFNGPSQQ